MTFDNTKNSLSLCYYIRQVNGVVSKAKAMAKAQELEARLHELMKENKTLKLKLSLADKTEERPQGQFHFP